MMNSTDEKFVAMRNYFVLQEECEKIFKALFNLKTQINTNSILKPLRPNEYLELICNGLEHILYLSVLSNDGSDIRIKISKLLQEVREMSKANDYSPRRAFDFISLNDYLEREGKVIAKEYAGVEKLIQKAVSLIEDIAMKRENALELQRNLVSATSIKHHKVLILAEFINVGAATISALSSGLCFMLHMPNDLKKQAAKFTDKEHRQQAWHQFVKQYDNSCVKVNKLCNWVVSGINIKDAQEFKSFVDENINSTASNVNVSNPVEPKLGKIESRRNEDRDEDSVTHVSMSSARSSTENAKFDDAVDAAAAVAALMQFFALPVDLTQHKNNNRDSTSNKSLSS